MDSILFKYHQQYQIIFISNSLSFPVVCVIFPDFSCSKFPDWRMPYHFSSPSGNPADGLPVVSGTFDLFNVMLVV